MGFKRTSEGRVFFQGGNQTANDHREGSSQQTQTQILALLRALNEKLKSTQTERNKMRQELAAYRHLIEDLESKAERSERAYLDLEQKLSRKENNAEGRAARAEQLAKETMSELEETRKLLLQLEDKTEKADKGVILLKNKIGEAQQISSALSKKQAALEKWKEDNAGNLETSSESYNALISRVQAMELKQEDLSFKVEETVSQHEKLVRKIDKAVEDRARFMRKIERIEETVLQTRDALNAKAMVLLTDQEAQGHPSVAIDDPVLAANAVARDAGHDEAYEDAVAGASWWHKRVKLETAAVVFLVISSVLIGWLISEVQKPRLPGESAFDIAEFHIPWFQAGETDIAPSSYDAGEEAAAPDWQVSEDTSAFSAGPQEQPATAAETRAYAPPASDDKADDIGALDLNNQEQLAALLEKNPDAVAAELNKIEPSLSDKTRAILDGTETPDGQENLQTASLPPAGQADMLQQNEVSDDYEIKPDGTLPDVVKEIEKQAFAGVPEAQHDLAAIYTAGHGGVLQNYERASYWFREAAEAGVANAGYNLGVMYHQGLGVPINIEEAISWYGRSAKLGHPEAQYNLGIAYIEGIGVEYDPATAAQNFKSAAEQGVMEAAYNLGLIYENGLLGVPQPDEALLWYKSAADQGSPEAKAALAQLAKTLNISLGDVNRLVDGMKATEKKNTTTNTSSTASAVSKKSAQSPAKGQAVLVAQIQEYLMGIGLYPGPADGVSGPLTEDAIRSYQALNDLAVDGKASSNLLSHMLSNDSETALGEVGSRVE